MKKFIILILFYSPLSWSNSLIKISDVSLGYGQFQGRVATGGIKVPANFNNLNFRLNLESYKIPDYYLGLELNLLKNSDNFSSENILLALGFKSFLNKTLYGTGELKAGWGFMKDQGALYKRESLSGQVIGASMGLHYNPPTSPLIIGININWLHQIHGKGFWGREDSSDTVIDQFGPMLILGYKF